MKKGWLPKITLGPGQCQYVILALAMHGISVQTVLHMVFVMPRMSQQDRAIAVGLLEANWPVKAVARRLGVSPKAIRKLHDKFERTGAVQDLPRSGRPRVTTRRADRYLGNIALRTRTLTANEVRIRLQAGDGARISNQTVRRRLHAAGLHARQLVKKALLLQRHKAARLRWARHHARWTRVQWSNVMFTDELRVCLCHIDGRKRVWRRRGEQHSDCCVLPVTAYGGGSVMVWAGICAQRKTELVHIEGNLNAHEYIAQVLEPHVAPFAEAVGENFTFMDDNARPHRARVVNEFLQDRQIERMVWPASSPDLNPCPYLQAFPSNSPLKYA